MNVEGREMEETHKGLGNVWEPCEDTAASCCPTLCLTGTESHVTTHWQEKTRWKEKTRAVKRTWLTFHISLVHGGQQEGVLESLGVSWSVPPGVRWARAACQKHTADRRVTAGTRRLTGAVTSRRTELCDEDIHPEAQLAVLSAWTFSVDVVTSWCCSARANHPRRVSSRG